MKAAPDFVLSSQLGRRHEPALAERRLWAAVLTDAIGLARGTGAIFTNHRNRERLRTEARQWIADASEDFASFGWACGLIGLDGETIRRVIVAAEARP